MFILFRLLQYCDCTWKINLLLNNMYLYYIIINIICNISMCVSGSPPKPTLRVFNDQQEVMKTMEVMEGSSVSLRCSTKIFCPSRPPSLTWSSSLNDNITEQQYQSQTELISDLNFTVSHLHHEVTFTCSATHQLQKQKKTTQRYRVRVQCKTTINLYWMINYNTVL